MTTRKTSTEATFETDPWTPASETFVQVDGATDTTVVTIFVRVDDTVAWVPFMTFKPSSASEQIKRLAQVPRMKVAIRGNTAGNSIMISTGEI